MGWSIGFDSQWQRDIGYGVPAICDHPDCSTPIDRGLAYVCGNEPYGGEHGCGLYFCGAHLSGPHQQCWRCMRGRKPFIPKADCPQWMRHKLTDASWQQWRDENPEDVQAMRRAIASDAKRAKRSTAEGVPAPHDERRSGALPQLSQPSEGRSDD